MLLYEIVMIVWLIGLVYIIYKKTSEYFILYFYLLFTHIWMIASNIFIENGVYLIQTSRWSRFTGSTASLLLIDTVFFGTICVSLLLFAKRRDKRKKEAVRIDDTIKGKNENVWLNIFIIVSLYCLVDVLISGNILTNSSVSKGNYYAQFSKLPFARIFDAMFLCFGFVDGMIIWESYKNGKKRRIIKCVIPILIVLAARLLKGMTFTTNLIFLLSIAIPILMNANLRGIKIKRKYIFLAILLGVSLIGIKIYDFSLHSSYYSGVSGTTTALGKLIYRGFGLQGEVWWGIDDLVVNSGAADPSQISNEISSMYSNESLYDAGIYHLMNLLGHNYTKDGSDNLTLNCGYPAIIISMFGYSFITFLIVAIEGIVYVMVLLYVDKYRRQKRYAHVFCLYGILSDLNVAFIMGGAYYFTTTKILICILGLAILKLGFKNKRMNVVTRGRRNNGIYRNHTHSCHTDIQSGREP